MDLKGLPKWQRDLVEDESKAMAFDFNIKLVDLNTKFRPKPKDMFINKGEPSAENFKRMCEVLLFNSFLKDFANWISIFPAGMTTDLAAA